ncbi:MAG: type II toxin-antitoxin system Phd/YefM family antitoxin [Calothrix sp. MO_192.B10]|nr:type II toxin-antitoxin system Phd/YefM family antitoxin [Calothrix sp. MO_192.B10]
MLNRYSIAKARDKFAQIVHAVEQGKSVKITRRGKPVAVVLSLKEYQRLTDRQIGFGEGLEAFRKKYQVQNLDLDPDKIFNRWVDG